MKIIINGKEQIVDGPTLSYEEVVWISGLPKAHLYTVTYVKADQPDKMSGFLAPSESVKIQEGTIINVSDTSNA